jgi:hypothetical protein
MKAREATAVHTRLLRCALEIDDCRAYWAHATGPRDARIAFEEYWFGARSLARVELLMANMAVRFDAFPPSLAVLHGWPHMCPDTRRAICHWHLQLADPLYRQFTGTYLVERREGPRPEITRDRVVAWMAQQDAGRWTLTTRVQFASKLLSAAFSAGLVASNRDPRPLTLPRIPDEALAYLLHLLRDVEFEGTLVDSRYAGSVGLEPTLLEDRLRALPGIAFRRQADLVDFGWQYSDLRAWAAHTLGLPAATLTTAAR